MTTPNIGAVDYAGRDVVEAPHGFGFKDADDRAVPTFNVGGVSGSTYLARQNLTGAIKGIRDAGVKVSEDVARLLDVLAGIDAYSLDGSVPDLTGMDRDAVTDALAEVVRVRSQRDPVADVKGEFVDKTLSELERAVRAEIPKAIEALRKPFDDAVSRYLADHDVLSAHPDAGSAAMADDTGETVRRFHAARKAADELTELGGLIFALRGTGSPKGSQVATGSVPALYGSFGDGSDVLVLADADGKSVLPRIIPAVVAAGGTLSLPTDLADWNERAATFTALVDRAREEANPR